MLDLFELQAGPHDHPAAQWVARDKVSLTIWTGNFIQVTMYLKTINIGSNALLYRAHTNIGLACYLEGDGAKKKRNARFSSQKA